MSISQHAVSDLADLPPYDGSMSIDLWKIARARQIKEITARKSALLRAQSADGTDLYRMTSGGNLSRTSPLSKTTRRKVIERDKVCVWCGSAGPLEVDHVTRYADGGSNRPDNLQALCAPCHRSKGGK